MTIIERKFNKPVTFTEGTSNGVTIWAGTPAHTRKVLNFAGDTRIDIPLLVLDKDTPGRVEFTASHNNLANADFFADNTGRFRWRHNFNNGDHRPRIFKDANTIVATPPLDTAEHKFTIDWDGLGGGNCYVDNETPTPLGAVADLSTAAPFHIGSDFTGTANFVTGIIKNVRFYDAQVGGELVHEWEIDDDVLDGGVIKDTGSGSDGGLLDATLVLGSGTWSDSTEPDEVTNTFTITDTYGSGTNKTSYVGTWVSPVLASDQVYIDYDEGIGDYAIPSEIEVTNVLEDSFPGDGLGTEQSLSGQVPDVIGATPWAAAGQYKTNGNGQVTYPFTNNSQIATNIVTSTNKKITSKFRFTDGANTGNTAGFSIRGADKDNNFSLQVLATGNMRFYERVLGVDTVSALQPLSIDPTTQFLTFEILDDGTTITATCIETGDSTSVQNSFTSFAPDTNVGIFVRIASVTSEIQWDSFKGEDCVVGQVPSSEDELHNCLDFNLSIAETPLTIPAFPAGVMVLNDAEFNHETDGFTVNNYNIAIDDTSSRGYSLEKGGNAGKYNSILNLPLRRVEVSLLSNYGAVSGVITNMDVTSFAGVTRSTNNKTLAMTPVDALLVSSPIDGVAGSFYKHQQEQIAALIAGKTGGTNDAHALFTSYSGNTTALDEAFTRNVNCITEGLDLRGVCTHQDSGVYPFNIMMISARHGLSMGHASPSGTFSFEKSDGSFFRTTILGSLVPTTEVATDLRIVYFDTDLDPLCTIYRVMPENWEVDFVPSVRVFEDEFGGFIADIPYLSLQRNNVTGGLDGTATIATLREEENSNTGGVNKLKYNDPIDTNLSTFYRSNTSGDSSSPAFFLVNGEPILLNALHQTINSDNLSFFTEEVNAAMVQLATDGSHPDPTSFALNAIDLEAEGFTKYT